VGLYLNHIFPENDLREANKTQINLDSFLEEAKKQREEEENVIDEEPDDEEEDKSVNNSNINDKEIQEKKDKQDQNNDEKKVSDKKVCLNIKNIKRRTCFNIPLDNQRREGRDSTQKKLISRSKLLNMYYEVNDESTRSIKDQASDGILESKKSIESIHDENSKENGENKVNLETGNGQIDCKSDPGNPVIEQNNNYNSDNDSFSDENIPVLKRGLTIIEDPDNNKIQNNMITGKLNFIRSNFYNNFKI
jgi:hypothetical protein